MNKQNEQLGNMTVQELEQIANDSMLNIALVRKNGFISIRCYR